MIRSLWNDNEAKDFLNDDVDLRVYTSRLLGRDSSLVLHGGGNTSVKVKEKNIFGEEEELLYVKGSGWDLGTIERAGFAPVRMDTLLKMARLETLSDTDMVSGQKAAMTNPNAPTPSIEAILHAIIPFKFVDHTHTDAVVTITNTPNSEAKIKEIYGDSVLIIPYVMPGFILAKKIYDMTVGLNWSAYRGMVLMHHGLFTFSDVAKEAYENQIELVGLAEEYIRKNGAEISAHSESPKPNLLKLAEVRKCVSGQKGGAVIATLDDSGLSTLFSTQETLDSIANRGPLTPDHVIRTKRMPVILGDDVELDIKNYVESYKSYFEKNRESHHALINPAPNWAVWRYHGAISFGSSYKEALITNDIKEHTIEAILRAEKLGGWTTLSEKDIFDMEYWELEQAKLKKGGSKPALAGKIAVVSGGASGIGKACVEALNRAGCAVIALDIAQSTPEIFKQKDILGVVCDVTDGNAIKGAIEAGVKRFVGIDIVVSNAGIFPNSALIENIEEALWDKNLNINLTSHQLLLRETIPYLKLGVDPTIIMIASKNVPSPGPGAAAYSVAKAGQTQLGRVAALELAKYGVRVNMLHPHAVFDTGIWSDEVIESRAKAYNMSVDEYKKNNMLKTEIKSADVANLVVAMAGDLFAKVTGAQIAVDGGNERII